MRPRTSTRCVAWLTLTLLCLWTPKVHTAGSNEPEPVRLSVETVRAALKTTERDPELWRKVHDNQLGGDRMKLEALWQAQSGEVGQIDQNAPETAPDDWTPGVSIHPLELRFAETPACETSELFVTVYNTHARDPLTIMSLTTDLSVFQPKNVPGNTPPYDKGGAISPGGRKRVAIGFAPRSAGDSVGTLMVLTDKGSFLINAKGTGTPSPYKVTSLTAKRVPTRFPHVFALAIHNPHSVDLFLTEAITSDQFVQLASAPESFASGDNVRDGGISSDPAVYGLHDLNVTDWFLPTLESSGALFETDGGAASDRFPPRHADAASAVAFANKKMKEEDARYRDILSKLDGLPKRTQDESWVIPPGITKTVLFARLAISRVGHFEGSVRVKMRWLAKSSQGGGGDDSGNDELVGVDLGLGAQAVSHQKAGSGQRDAHNRVALRIPITVTSSVGIAVSPSQLDFGVAVRRSDRLRRTVDVFNGASRTARIVKLTTFPNDPSLRARLESGTSMPPRSESLKTISLTYSGKLEGFRVGALVIHLENGETIEVPYRARVVHGRLEFNDDDASFASPERGPQSQPFQTQTKTFDVVNGFPVALEIRGAVVEVDGGGGGGDAGGLGDTGANGITGDGGGSKTPPMDSSDISDSPDTCCLAMASTQKNSRPYQVVPPGGSIRGLTVTYRPKNAAQLFDARLVLTTNLTALSIPLRVYHGQLACYDAGDAATRLAAAAAAAAAVAYSTVRPAAVRASSTGGGGGGEQRVGNGAYGVASSSDSSSSRYASARANADDSNFGSVLGEEGSGLAVPCAVSDGRYREKEGLSIMGVIDFGVVQVGTTRLKRIAVRNPNPVPVAIVGVTSTVRAVTVARVEITASAVSAPVYASSVSALRVSSLAAGGKKAPFKPKPPQKGCLTELGKMAACEQSFLFGESSSSDVVGVSFSDGNETAPSPVPFAETQQTPTSHVIIPPDHVATIDVVAAPAEEELVRMGGMLSFALDNGRVLVAPVVLRALLGNVEVMESSQVIDAQVRRSGNRHHGKSSDSETQMEHIAVLEVPASFPGRTTSGELTLRSSFAEPVTVFGVSTNDPAIAVKVETQKLQPGKQIVVGKVVFDPSLLGDERAYTGLKSAPDNGGKVKYGLRSTETERSAILADAFESAKSGGRFGAVAKIFGNLFGARKKNQQANGQIFRSKMSNTAVANARALSLSDIFELKRARNAWATVVGGDDPHAASSAIVESVLTIHTDAVAEIKLKVVSKLIRPKMLLFSGDDDDDFETAFRDVDFEQDADDDKSAEEDFLGSGFDTLGSVDTLGGSAKQDPVKTQSERNSKKHAMAKSARVVDFGSTQVGAKTRRRRVVFINPFATDTLCVRMLPIVPASPNNRKGADRRVAGGKGALDDVLEAAEAHYRGEYPLHTGFLLEGGEVAPGRGVSSGQDRPAANGNSVPSSPRHTKDWTCLKPYQMIDLGALVFAPRTVGTHAAHLCVRNNFTTLECATLRGDGDAVKVRVAKSKKPKAESPSVSDVAFRVARGSGFDDNTKSSEHSVDVMTQVVFVVNDGTALARVSKPWVGAVECGGDGSVGGYTVAPCGAFQLAPGASKRLTVVCHPEHALRSSRAPGSWTQLVMEVKSADGESSQLVVQLSASAKVKGGVYFSGDLEEASAWFHWSWTTVFGTLATLLAAWFLSTEIVTTTKAGGEHGKVTSAGTGGVSEELSTSGTRGSEELNSSQTKQSPISGKTLSQRRRDARNGDGFDDKAAVLSTLETRNVREDSRTPGLAVPKVRTAGDRPGDEASPDSTISNDSPTSPDSEDAAPDTAPSPRVDSSAESAAAAIAAMTRAHTKHDEGDLSEQLPTKNGNHVGMDNSPAQSPVPSPKAGRRHAKETKPLNVTTLSSIPKPKVDRKSPVSSAPSSPVGVVSPKTVASPRDPARLAGTVKPLASVQSVKSAQSAPPPPVAPFVAPKVTPAAQMFQNTQTPFPGGGFTAGANSNSNSNSTRRPVDGGTWLAPPRPAELPSYRPEFPRTNPAPPLPTANGRPAGNAFVNPFVPTRVSQGNGARGFDGHAPVQNADSNAGTYVPSSGANSSAIDRDSPSPNANANATVGRYVPPSAAGGWVPSPPRGPPPSGTQTQSFAANVGVGAFGNGIGLNLLAGGGSGYNMWGAPAAPVASASAGNANANGENASGFVNSFFDPAPLTRERGVHAPAALEPRGAADLDAETEWSRHNKGLLDDLGLD